MEIFNNTEKQFMKKVLLEKLNNDYMIDGEVTEQDLLTAPYSKFRRLPHRIILKCKHLIDKINQK